MSMDHYTNTASTADTPSIEDVPAALADIKRALPRTPRWLSLATKIKVNTCTWERWRQQLHPAEHLSQIMFGIPVEIDDSVADDVVEFHREYLPSGR